MNLQVKVGVGVLGKDGEPWAPRTIHGVFEGEGEGPGRVLPVPYTIEALISLLVNPRCVSIEVVDGDNREFILTGPADG